MEIVSVKVGSPSQATKVSIEAPTQIKATFKDVIVNNGGGSVKSVNGQTGDVVLDAAAVGALPNTTKIPTNTSELTNNSGFITRTVSDLANYYLKSETYSKEELDNKISAIPKFSIEVVSSLPTANISDTTVYLVASGDEEDNLYTEYIYVNGEWEYLGKQTVDLTGYVKRTELSAYYTSTEIDSLLTTIRKSIPTKLSQLTEDSSHRVVTDTEKQSWNAKAEKATTLAGYGITDGATKDDVNQLSEEIADLKGTEIPDYWADHLGSKISAIKAHQDEAGKDGFSFIHIADPHFAQNLGKKSPLLAKYIMDKCNIRYPIVSGDFQDRSPKTTEAQIDEEWEAIEEMFKCIEELRQKGNHDGSYGSALNGTTYPKNLTPEKMHNRIYAKTYRHHNVVTDESGTGYYVDDTANKIRYILLNTHCNNYELNDDGSAKYNNMKMFRFTQSQYDMVVEALASMEDGWAVVVGAHVPIVEAYQDAWGGANSDFIVMRNLLKAYKNKTAYSANWAGTGSSAISGYTNLFDTSGTGFREGYRFDNVANATSFLTNEMPYSNGELVHIKGATPYKFKVYSKELGYWGNATYCTNASKPIGTSDYDSNVQTMAYTNADFNATKIQFEFRVTVPDELIITVGEEIAGEAGGETGNTGYDAVSVDVDFTSAKGEFVGYFSGHMHNDYVYKATDGYGVDIITTRCDSANENDSTLLAERVAGTITEQCFDVFTVNRKTKKIYATRIGAGSDRVIDY